MTDKLTVDLAIAEFRRVATKNEAEALTYTPNRNLVGFYTFSPIVNFVVAASNPKPVAVLGVFISTALITFIGLGTDYMNGKRKHVLQNNARVASSYARGLEHGLLDDFKIPDDIEGFVVKKAAVRMPKYNPMKDPEHRMAQLSALGFFGAASLMYASGSLVSDNTPVVKVEVVAPRNTANDDEGLVRSSGHSRRIR